MSDPARPQSALDAPCAADSPWQRAPQLQQLAAQAGFDWPDPEPVLSKLAEEVAEVREAFADGARQERLQDEIGDVLFVLANLARHADVDLAQAMRHANAKFERRFREMEQLAAAAGVAFAHCTLAEQEALWQRVKALERQRR